MKVYVFYYPDGDGEPSACYIFKTKEAAKKFKKENPNGTFGRTWFEERELNLDKDLMIDLNPD